MVRIAQITDLHLDDFLAEYYVIDARKNIMTVLTHVQQSQLQGMVITGDMGDIKAWPWLHACLLDTGLPFEIILGNHDRIENYAAFDWLKSKVKPSGLYYTASMGEGNWIYLDSHTGIVDPTQLQWLKKEIQTRETTENLIIFIHHPILDCGQSAMDRKSPLKNREQVKDVLGEFKGSAHVFCGHYHNTYSQTVGNITQHLTPSTLMQIRLDTEEIALESKAIGYRIIELDRNQINTRCESVDLSA